MENPSDQLVLDVETPLGFRVRVTHAYWEFLVSFKHPAMAGRQRDVERALATPDEVRRSRADGSVLLFYRAERMRRWICAVCRRLNGDGFLLTTYPTDAIKEGDRVWPE